MLLLRKQDKHYIEGYAAALQDAMQYLTGDNRNSKTYDPMTVELESQVMHSYAFDMKDGGRHHRVSDYESVGEILNTLLQEACKAIREDT